MRRVIILSLAGLAGWLGWGKLAAQGPDLPNVQQATFRSHDTKECSPAPCKVIVHQAQPEVVYEDEPACAPAPKAKSWRLRREQAPAQVATVSSVLSPMSFGTSFVAQPASLNALGIGVTTNSLAAQTSSLQADFSDLQSLHQMNVLAAQIRASREIRDAHARAQEAYAQQLQTHLSSLATQMAGTGRGPDGTQRLTTQALAAGDVAALNARIDRLQARIDAIDAKLQEVAALLQKK